MDRGPSKVSTRFMTTLFDDVMSRPPAVTIGGETKRKRKSGTKGSAFASIYKEDLGSTAVKSSYTNRVTTTTVPFKVPLTKKEKERRDERKERFAPTNANNGTALPTKVDPLYQPLTVSRKAKGQCTSDMAQEHDGALVGENQNLEKPYLRLTTFPKKEDVRPLKVLVKALSHVKNQYIKEEDFEWANEQLKSIRQDMTVQRIRNKFVIEVYETHARILLEHGDLNEFNQCQTMIRSLTEGGNEFEDSAEDSMGEGDFESPKADASFKALNQTPESADEFRGYAILYSLVRDSPMQLKTEIARAKSTVGVDCGRETSCGHAMQVVKAIDDNDYRSFFRLYECAPHMSPYLMDFLVKRVRDRAYERIIAAYRPSVSVEHFRECLRFEDLEETRRFLRLRGAVFVKEKGGPPFWIDCKASSS